MYFFLFNSIYLYEDPIKQLKIRTYAKISCQHSGLNAQIVERLHPERLNFKLFRIK